MMNSKHLFFQKIFEVKMKKTSIQLRNHLQLFFLISLSFVLTIKFKKMDSKYES